MSWQLSEDVEHRVAEAGPDFPHAWTFSAQRYVPRPRPVARIILPSHQRPSSPVRPEVPYTIVVSRSSSMQSLLKFAREDDELVRMGKDVWIHRPWSICKLIVKLTAAVKSKIVGCYRQITHTYKRVAHRWRH